MMCSIWGGRLEGRALLVDASGDVVNRSGAIRGDDVAIKAGGNVLNISSTRAERHDTGHEERLNQVGTIAAGSSLRIEAGDALDVTAGGDVSITVGTSGSGDVVMLGSSVRAGGDVDVAASGELVVASVENQRESHKSSSSKGLLSSSASRKDNRTITQVGSSITGENVSLTSRKDTVISASAVQAENNLTVGSREGDVRVVAGQDTAYSRSEKSKSSFGLWLHDSGLDVQRASESMRKAASETNVGSQLSAGNDLSVTAANDATVVGSQLGAGNMCP